MRGTQRGTERLLRIVHGDDPSASQASCTTEYLDFIFTHQESHTPGETLGHLSTARNHLAEIEAQIVAVEAKVGAMLHELVHFGITQQCFRGDTTPVQTDPSKRIALYQCHLHAELRRPNRRDISTWTSPDNHHVTRMLCLSHVLPFQSCACAAALPIC